MSDDGSNLQRAYTLRSPAECLELYADWAKSYDADFASARAYALPLRVAEAFLAASPPAGSVLDVGAGTGLVAAALRALGHGAPLEAVDISPQMLEVAREKGLYAALHVTDITRPLPAGCGPYAGIVSAGTFTHGHVGPEALAPLLAATLPGAVVALSVNLGVWETRGFPQALAALGDRIDPPEYLDVPIYGGHADAAAEAPAGDRARILRFRTR